MKFKKKMYIMYIPLSSEIVGSKYSSKPLRPQN